MNFNRLTLAHDTYWFRLLPSYHTKVISREFWQGYVKTQVTQFIATMMLWIITQRCVSIVFSKSYCIGLNVVSLINYEHRKAMWSSKNECCWFGLTNKSKTMNNSWTIPSTNRSAAVPIQMKATNIPSWLQEFLQVMCVCVCVCVCVPTHDQETVISEETLHCVDSLDS